MTQKKSPWFRAFSVGIRFSRWSSLQRAFWRPFTACTIRPTVIEAQEFRLVDRQGEQRGRFMLAPSGDAVIMLYDKDGKLAWVAPEPLRPFQPLG